MSETEQERPAGRTRLAAVDDHPLILHGLRAVFAERAPEVNLTRVAPTVEALTADEEPADVVLLDLLLPGEPDVADNVTRLRATGARVVIFTSDSRPGIVRRAIDAGALGLVLKGDPEDRLVDAVLAARRGEFFVSSRLAHVLVTDPRAGIRLTQREREVLELVARGLPHRLIAKRIGISVNTLPSYLRRAAKRYADARHPTGSAAELVAFALADGHISIGDEPRAT
jgi:DNA-binding NarL/FixJ family response regulator